MLGSSSQREDIQQQEQMIKGLGISNVKTYQIGDEYYLLQTDQQTKSKALITAIQIQEKHNELKPVLIQLESRQ